jgi:cytochrome c-type biogenesis protein CcmH
MNAAFWFTAGVLTGVLATALAMPLWRSLAGALAARPRAYLITAAGVVVFACSAALLSMVIGSPASLQQRSGPAAALAHPVTTDTAQESKALSMQEATARLAARLERDGGSNEEWELLAKSYDFLGRAEDASRARAHAGTGTGTAGPATAASSAQNANMPSLADVASQMRVLGNQAGRMPNGTMPNGTMPHGTMPDGTMPNGTTAGAPEAVTPPAGPPDTQAQAKLEHQVKAHPDDASAWLALAEIYRRNHNAKAAQTAYQKLTALHAMTAQAWADYADVLGSQSGNSLNGAAGSAIDQALALDPKNPKALWLDASRALQERRYGDALELWKRLRGVLPADSPDAQLVDANIAEAQSLAGADGAITGTVSIESRLASRVEPDATLFIYAKAADSPGPPLAVLRLTTGRWPVSFRLDDSMAMLPSRRLSQFQKVVVEARISRTGQATPAAGDLYVTSNVLTPSSGKKLALVINHEIG